MVKRRKSLLFKGSDKAKALGLHFRKIRKEKGIGQTELAQEADVDRTTIVRLESGELSPTLDLLIILAEALQVELKDLVDF